LTTVRCSVACRVLQVLPVQVYFVKGAPRRWVLVSEFIGFSDVRFFRYFVAWMSLCAALCMGGNKFAIDFVSKEYPRDTLMALLLDGYVPPNRGGGRENDRDILALKTAVVSVLLAVYVDAPPFRDMSYPATVRFVASATADAADVAEAKVSCSENAHLIRDVTAFASHYLSHLTGFDANEVSRNRLTLAVLELVLRMLELGGYMEVDDLSRLVQPVVEALSWSCNAPTPREKRQGGGSITPSSGGGGASSGSVELLNEVRVLMCRVLMKVMDVDLDTRLSVFVAMFRGKMFLDKRRLDVADIQEHFQPTMPGAGIALTDMRQDSNAKVRVLGVALCHSTSIDVALPPVFVCVLHSSLAQLVSIASSPSLPRTHTLNTWRHVRPSLTPSVACVASDRGRRQCCRRGTGLAHRVAAARLPRAVRQHGGRRRAAVPAVVQVPPVARPAAPGTGPRHRAGAAGADDGDVAAVSNARVSHARAAVLAAPAFRGNRAARAAHHRRVEAAVAAASRSRRERAGAPVLRVPGHLGVPTATLWHRCRRRRRERRQQRRRA
jgi:hypothetical protein